jgi:hypothetical protein
MATATSDRDERPRRATATSDRDERPRRATATSDRDERPRRATATSDRDIDRDGRRMERRRPDANLLACPPQRQNRDSPPRDGR